MGIGGRKPAPRQLRIGAGTSVLHQHCVKCGRDFLFDQESANAYAVSVSALSFHLLDATVTANWGRELCPEQHLLGDDEDRKGRIAELFIFDKPEPSESSG